MAMILAVLAQPEEACPTVGLEHVRVAIALADESAKVFSDSLSANRKPAWDDPQGQCELVLDVIQRSPAGISRADLLTACRRLTARTIGEVIERLVEEERITVLVEPTKGRPRNLYLPV
jgi:hypothetical protein